MKAFNETEVDLLEDDDLDTLKAQRIKEMKAEAMRLQVPLVSGPWSRKSMLFREESSLALSFPLSTARELVCAGICE